MKFFKRCIIAAAAVALVALPMAQALPMDCEHDPAMCHEDCVPCPEPSQQPSPPKPSGAWDASACPLQNPPPPPATPVIPGPTPILTEAGCVLGEMRCTQCGIETCDWKGWVMQPCALGTRCMDTGKNAQGVFDIECVDIKTYDQTLASAQAALGISPSGH